jgi:hypothetical protein
MRVRLLWTWFERSWLGLPHVESTIGHGTISCCTGSRPAGEVTKAIRLQAADIPVAELRLHVFPRSPH